MTDPDLIEITRLLNEYFEGLYNADTKRLRQVFHPTANLQSQGLRLTRDEWLHRVVNRAIPSEINESYRYKIINIDILGEQAMAKVECPLLGNFYIDFLSLLKEKGQWTIVNKMYANAPENYQRQSNTGE
ncbi:nuclear transport factor 2 family protein [Methyloprofundus sp.]|uniref:nuclear transport factor 2 family protein n=1 Tax=Methyloprofundus sp. TaxID=2020875 RepID=UPI003D0A07AF